MPLGSNWNLEWLNHNSQRRYPLAEDASILDTTGSFSIPDDFIVELDLPVHAGMDVDPGRMFVSNIGAYAGGYSIIVSYQPFDNSAPIVVASALIPRQVHLRNTTYALGGVAPFDDTVGKLVIGRLDNIDQQPPGFWTFNLADARIEPDAVRPIIRGVSSLTCVNGDQVGARLYGDIQLIAGQNMRISAIVVAGQNPIIRFDAISGEGTVDSCVCTGDEVPTAPIAKINGVVPTPGGDFTVIGSDALKVVPINNGLQLVDTASSPCCGCKELETITQDLERLGKQSEAVQEFVNNLQDAVNTMSLTVLGAKLGDAGCVTCP